MKHRKYRPVLARRSVPGKPPVENIWRGIPEMEIFDNDSDMPVVVEKHRGNRETRVENGDILTLRLGMHTRSRPLGIGAFTGDCIAVCNIPTGASKNQRITALFAQPDIAPVVFMDDQILYADTPFHLELVDGSAKLEHNCGEKTLILSKEAITQEDDAIIIINKVQTEVPDFCTYTFDFVSIQVRVVFES